MIGPTTRIFGLVTLGQAGTGGGARAAGGAGLAADRAPDGWLANLYNYIYGYNGLDAAYVTFVVRPDTIEAALRGFVASRKAERLHVSPSCQEAVARFFGSPLPWVDTLTFERGGRGAGEDAGVVAGWEHPGAVEGWRAIEPWISRARRETKADFGDDVLVPPDIRAAIAEPRLRPCKMTDDDFKVRHATLRAV